MIRPARSIFERSGKRRVRRRLHRNWTMCQLAGRYMHERLQLLRTLRIQTLDGEESTILSIDRIEVRQAEVVKKSRRDASGAVDGRLGALRAGGYELAGMPNTRATVPALASSQRGARQETCLLDDPAAPPRCRTSLHHMTLRIIHEPGAPRGKNLWRNAGLS